MKRTPPAKPARAKEMPKLDVLPDVKAALMRRRADTGKPMWRIADEVLRAELGLKPIGATA